MAKIRKGKHNTAHNTSNGKQNSDTDTKSVFE